MPETNSDFASCLADYSVQVLNVFLRICCCGCTVDESTPAVKERSVADVMNSTGLDEILISHRRNVRCAFFLFVFVSADIMASLCSVHFHMNNFVSKSARPRDMLFLPHSP